MRKALIVGINYYESAPPLCGCINDANQVKEVLECNEDNTPNFDVKTLIGSMEHPVSRTSLKKQIIELFKSDGDALFYFSGHGYLESTGGFLITSENKNGDEGMSMTELLNIANKSKAQNKIIILDCCHSGIAGNLNSMPEGTANLSTGLTILTASSEKQYASEKNCSGVFTSLFVDALKGGASNLIGEITPGSIYAHIDKALGSWGQRPLFKTNIKKYTSLRKVNPPISRKKLRKIITLFKTKEMKFMLDPSFEPTESNNIKLHTNQFKILQKYRSVNLVIPEGEKHMYYAAINSKSCVLTALGKYYWDLVNNKRI